MKNILFTTIIASAILTSCHKAETTISFNLTDLPEGTVIELSKVDGRVNERVYIDTVNGGICCFAYKCDSVEENPIYSVKTINGLMHSNRNIYVKENCGASIYGSGFYTQNWKIDSKNPRQQFFNKKNDALKDVSIEIAKIEAEAYDAATTQEKRDSLLGKIGELQKKRTEMRFAIIDTLPINEYWLDEFASLTAVGPNSPNYPKMTELYNRLSDADKATPVGKHIALDLFGKAPAVGDKVIDYDLYDVDGNLHHLSEFQGKWLLVEFGAYFCGPCRMFVPTIKYFYERGINKKLEIVTLNAESQKLFKKLISEEKYTTPIWNDRDGRNGIFALYKINSVPTFYLISPDGTIANTWQGIDPQHIADIAVADVQPEPEFKTENGVSVIINPAFSSNNSVLFIDKVELYADSTVLNCTCAIMGGYLISPDGYLSVNGKRVSTITKADVRLGEMVRTPFGEVGHCRLTFEPLPKNTTEFDFIECDSEDCFRIMGVKIK